MQQRQPSINRTCPLCTQFVPTDVEQYLHQIGTENRVIHATCVKKLAEMYLNRMYTESKRSKKEHKKGKKKSSGKKKTPVEA